MALLLPLPGTALGPVSDQIRDLARQANCPLDLFRHIQYIGMPSIVESGVDEPLFAGARNTINILLRNSERSNREISALFYMTDVSIIIFFFEGLYFQENFNIKNKDNNISQGRGNPSGTK